MSFRELRNFSEMLRALGYPRLVSIENFRNPNFPLVAEVLEWLISRFDPTIETLGDIDTEQDRVIFIKTAAQLMSSKAQIKINTKKLYMADGHAVQELLKITNVLYEASKHTDVQENEENASIENFLNDPSVITKISELKKSRELVSEITAKGANLYDLFAKEIDLREQRAAVLARQLEIPEIERAIRDSIKETQNEIEKMNYKIDNVAADEANLDAKIEKKKGELERNQKRLHTLRSVRPAFMDEYEKLEEELSYIYELYVTKFRCLTFLEQQLEEIEENELEKIQQRDEQIKRMVQQMQEEEFLKTDNENDTIDDLNLAEDDDEITDDIGTNQLRMSTGKMRRSMINTVTATERNKRSATGRVRMFGSILDAEKDDSLGSDLDLEDDDDDDDASDLDSEDEMELINLTSNKKKSKNDTQTKQNDSDNDF